MNNITNQATKLNCELTPKGRRDLRLGEGIPPFYLVVMNGGLPGRMIRLSPGEVSLGRAEDNAVPVFDIDVSRYHAILRVRETGEVWVSDLNSTNGTFRNGERLPGRVGTPVVDGDQLQFGSTIVFKYLRPSPSDERLLQLMFERAACDQLTGLYNRAYFLDQVVYQAMRSSRLGHGLTILLLDIDHFKRINDTYGHDVGDEVLRMTAGVLRESVRSDDIVARYGGEEFVLALGAPDAGRAVVIAEQVRATLATRPILAGGHSVMVTASLGGVFCEAGKFREPVELIKSADLALYRAKNSGRNRVRFEGNPMA